MNFLRFVRLSCLVSFVFAMALPSGGFPSAGVDHSPLALPPFTFIGRIGDSYSGERLVEMRAYTDGGAGLRTLIAKSTSVSLVDLVYRFRLDVPVATAAQDGYVLPGTELVFEFVDDASSVFVAGVPEDDAVVGNPGESREITFGPPVPIVCLSQANIFAEPKHDSYTEVTLTTDDDYDFEAFAIIGTVIGDDDHKYCQIKSYADNRSYVKIPKMPGAITNITLTVTGCGSQKMGEGGNEATYSFCAENGGTVIASADGSAMVTIAMPNNTLKTGYINVDKGTRIWDIRVFYAIEPCEDCITFSANEAFGIKMWAKGAPTAVNVRYSTDQTNWKPVIVGGDYDAVQNGDTYKIHFRGRGNSALAQDALNYNAFTNAADSVATAIACSGNVMTLLDYRKVAKGEEPTMDAYAFVHLFQGFAALTMMPELPARTLQDYCYSCMFQGCTSLVVNTVAPGREWKIPAESSTATDWGKDMFKDTGGNMSGTPELNTTYYVGATKESVGDMTLYRYGDQVGVSVAGELTKAMADSIRDKGITNLIVGAGVTGIGRGAFEGWRSLRDVQVSADCTTIGADAFGKARNITNVVVKGGVSIGDYAFLRCNSLEKLTFESMPEFGKTPFAIHSAIYMKDGLPEVYAVPQVVIAGYRQALMGTNELKGEQTEWTEITTEEQKTQYHFFKIEMIEE